MSSVKPCIACGERICVAFDDNARTWVALEVPLERRQIYKQVRGKTGIYHVKKVLMAYVKHQCAKFVNRSEGAVPPPEPERHFSEAKEVV